MAHAGEIEQPVSWLYRVAFRLAAQELAREGTTTHDESASTADLDSAGLAELFSALAKLPPRQRAAVFLHYQMDLPVSEIAYRLQVSAATARVHLWRGRNQLKALLGEGNNG
jgi:RNA polymerase sigma-70 factor (ECF subfamily)